MDGALRALGKQPKAPTTHDTTLYGASRASPHGFLLHHLTRISPASRQTHHSGYRLPWIAGFDEQPDFHDFHHQRFNCCYGNIGWLDALHGTNKMYLEHWRQKKAARDAEHATWEAAAAEIRRSAAAGGAAARAGG